MHGGKVAENLKITFSPGPQEPESESHSIAMTAFGQEADYNTIYILPWSEQGYTLMPMENPHYPNQLIFIIKEIFETEGKIVGMSYKAWDSIFRERHPLFGLYSYLELEATLVATKPALTAVEGSILSNEVQDLLPLAASS